MITSAQREQLRPFAGLIKVMQASIRKQSDDELRTMYAFASELERIDHDADAGDAFRLAARLILPMIVAEQTRRAISTIEAAPKPAFIRKAMGG